MSREPLEPLLYDKCGYALGALLRCSLGIHNESRGRRSVGDPTEALTRTLHMKGSIKQTRICYRLISIHR